MLKGSIALVIRYILLIGGGGLASAGLFTATADPGFFCFDSKVVADAGASAIALALGGGASVAAGVGWRWWARKRGGVT